MSKFKIQESNMRVRSVEADYIIPAYQGDITVISDIITIDGSYYSLRPEEGSTTGGTDGSFTVENGLIISYTAPT